MSKVRENNPALSRYGFGRKCDQTRNGVFIMAPLVVPPIFPQFA